MPLPHPPAQARAWLDRLAAHDPDLARIEVQAGPLPWRVRPAGFPGFLQAIVAQQISNQAAAAIWRRVSAIPGASEPAGLLLLSDEALRGAGLSRPKIAHARALALAFTARQLEDAALQQMDDEAAIAAITAVRGLGRWTAEVYLLFALGRPDVFPAADLVLASAAADIKRLPERPTPAALRALAEEWRPWRGLAARLLWHHWRYLNGRPAFDDVPLVPATAA
jgi:DNA-3-methyladenine glycosylase II